MLSINTSTLSTKTTIRIAGETVVFRKSEKSDMVQITELKPKLNMDEGSGEATKKRLSFRQIVNLATVASTRIFIGMIIGWVAVLPKLEEDTSRFKVSKEHVSWLASMSSIMGLASSLSASPLIEYLGPRRMILCAIFPMPGFWIMMAYTPYLSLLFVGNAGVAISSYLISIALQPLVADISPPNIRGLVSSCTEIIATLGVLLSYILAHFLPWDIATAASAVPCIPIFIMLLTVPESPYWLFRQNKMEEAEQSLKKLTVNGTDVKAELTAISNAFSPTKASFKDQISHLRKRQYARPVWLLWIVFFLRELSGKSQLFSYSVYMFRLAKVEIDPFVCTILIGLVRLLGSVVTALTMDLIGRRPFLIGSSFICGLSISLTGVCLLIDLPGMSWIPLTLLLIFVGSFGIGLGPIPWLYVGELIPAPVRSLVASVITATYNLEIIGLNYGFLKILANIDLSTMLIIFGLPNLLVALIVTCWFPETRGKTLQELEKEFQNKKVVQHTQQC